MGRREHLDRLLEGLAEARAGGGRLVLIGGEPGIGKTRLMLEFAAKARAAGHPLVDAAMPGMSGLELPYAGLLIGLRGLSADLADTDAADLRRVLDELVAEMSEPAAGAMPLWTDASGKLRLFERVRGTLALLSQGGAAVLLLDDLQWADQSTRELLGYLAWNLPHGLLVVASYRSSMLGLDEALSLLVVELGSLASSELLDIGPLSQLEIEAQVRSLVGASANEETIEGIFRRSGGNPLFAEELAAAGAVAPSATLVSLLLARVRAMPERAQTLARLAAVAGSGVPAAALEAAAKRSGVDIGGAGRLARGSGVLDVVDTPAGPAYAFRHPVMQEVVYAEMLPGETAEFHRLLGDEVAALGATANPYWLFELARHRWNAGDAAAALPALVAAGGGAMGIGAFAEALDLYERALDLRSRTTAPGGDPQHRIGFRSPREDTADVGEADLLVQTAQAASLAGAPKRAVELMRERITHGGGDDPRLRARLAVYLWEAGSRVESVAAYRELAPALPTLPPAERAPILRLAASALLQTGEALEARVLAEGAVDAARAAASDRETSLSLALLSACLAMTGDARAAMDAIAQQQHLGGGQGGRHDPVTPSQIVDLLNARWAQATALRRVGRPDEAAHAALEGVEDARQLQGDGVWLSAIGASAVQDLVDAGRWDEAEALAADILDRAGHDVASLGMLAAHAHLLALRGDLERSAATLHASSQVVGGSSAQRGRVALAGIELALRAERLDEAARLADEALGTVSPHADPLLFAEVIAACMRVVADQLTLAASGRHTAQLRGYEARAAELRGQLAAVAAAASTGDEQRSSGRLNAVLGLAAAEFGRASQATTVSAWVAVADGWAAAGQPYPRAYALWRAAEAAARARGGRSSSETYLRESSEIARRLGAEPLLREIEATARRHRVGLRTQVDGASDEAPPTPPPKTTVPFGLSARELEVIALLAAGRTNRQVAEALFITEKTAGHHVSNILAKMGVANRAEAAAVAARHRMLGRPEPTEPSAADTDDERTIQTLFFSDMVESTALVEAIGDAAWNQLVRWHDATLRALFASFGGREVDHAGDGFFVAFREPTDALDCAIAIQRTLAEHRRQHGFAPRLRIGIHRASVIVEGQRLRGQGVHVAARIAASAVGEEVLVSRETADGLMHLDVGDTRVLELHGLGQPVEVLELRWRGSQSGASPPRSGDPSRSV